MKKAFTLIELLIVVAIIAILAAIAVPNFMEAQVRSKVSRCRADIRSMATAVESYRVDFNRPPLMGGSSYAVSSSPNIYTYGAELKEFSMPISMTTPIAYLTSMPTDPFGGPAMSDDAYQRMGKYAENYWFFTKKWFEDFNNGMYVNNWVVSKQARPGDDGRNGGKPAAGTASWVIMSKGPDKYWAKVDAWEVDCPQMWAYDSTNGTISIGNVFTCD